MGELTEDNYKIIMMPRRYLKGYGIKVRNKCDFFGVIDPFVAY